MKIYTRTGDQGKTSVIGGRVPKDDLRVEAYGTVDELNSFIGQAISFLEAARFADMRQDLLRIQHELFDCGVDLAYADPEKQTSTVTPATVDRLEEWIDRYDQELEPIRHFILPGGSRISATLHVCRTVCRRAERRVVSLVDRQKVNEAVRSYLNRLSDLLFVMARVANVREGIADIQYQRNTEVDRNSP